MEDSEDAVISRISLRSLSVLYDNYSEEEIIPTFSENHDERKWRLSYLKNQFESFELDSLYKIYTEKINHGYFSLFLILQFTLSLIHLILVAISNKDLLNKVLPDIALYSLTCLSSLIGLLLVDKFAEKYHKLHYLSVFAFVLVFFVNIFIPYYHGNDGHYKPVYSIHLILSCYLFFGVHNHIVAFIMGLAVSIIEIITLILITYAGNGDGSLWKRIISDIIFLSFVNCLGIYYRYMNEIITKRSFLDRRDCINSTLQLKHEELQVEQLMHSILPKYVLNKVKEQYIKDTQHFFKNGKILRKNPFDSSLLDKHENVTILFADIVNYTEMTIKLEITDLLETLNELFGEFDEASEKLKVTRIKFLGDCYYCVSGLPPDAAENPAEACVDLGLGMISTIANIRKNKSLDINMRIGIHTGKIISGIIGSVKYQFDIWSKDVDIANKMESEGSAGQVHITNKTKDCLTKNYNIIPTNKGETVPQFKKAGLCTYLISPDNNTSPRISLKKVVVQDGILLNKIQRGISTVPDDEVDNNSGSNQYFTNTEENSRIKEPTTDGTIIEKMYKKRTSNMPYPRISPNARRITNNVKRRTAFMNNTLKRYFERKEAVNEEMENTIKSISFSKYQQYLENVDISIWLLFKKKELELEYVKLPDPLFKYYLVGTMVLILFIYFLQNISLIRWDWTTWHFLMAVSLITFIFLPISWTNFLYDRFISKSLNEPPSNKFMYFFYETSKKVTDNFFIRLSIFSLIYLVLFVSVMVELIECKNSIHGHDENITETNLKYKHVTYGSELDCVIPWHMTETTLMTIIMIFLFLKILIWIKLFYGILMLIVYSYCVINFSDGYFKDSATFNYSMKPQAAHIMITFFLILTLHLIDRQRDYMNRLSYLLDRRVKSEQERAHQLEFVNENLLLNILPKHVAKIYLDVSREMKELYFEKHNDVAIMFASIITPEDLQEDLGDHQFLVLMNRYINSFDTISNRPDFRTIEKIKIAKWTYMAACGIFPGEDARKIIRHHTNSNLDTLLTFASEMYKKMDQINRNDQQQCKLRIGICQGSIVAGVVGSKKPLYDIWGDPVNMASRMDSTGVPNYIQVMASTAQIITNLGYVCESRGKIKVKGVGEPVETYFVRLCDDFSLRKSPR